MAGPRLSEHEVRTLRREKLDTWGDEVLGCRDAKHGWDKRKARYEPAEGGLLQRSMRCRDCKMRKVEYFIMRTGERHGYPQYVPDDKNYYARGLGTFSPAEIRREEFSRMAGRLNGGG